MKNIIYAFLFLALPISMAGKDPTAIKADSPAATKAAKQEEIKTPPAPSIVKHDTVYVAVKEMPEENVWTLPTIITIILAAISLFTLLEMKAQRKAAYKPVLVIPKVMAYIRENHGSVRYYNDDPEKVGNSTPELYFNLLNISSVSAKYINFRITIEEDAYLKLWEVLETIVDTKITYNMRGDDDKYYYRVNPLNNQKEVYIFYDNIMVPFVTIDYFNFVLPIAYSNENNKSEIIIPKCYTYLYMLYNRHKSKLQDLKFPSLKLEITYSDIMNNQYKLKYNITLKPFLNYEQIYQYTLFFMLEPQEI